MIDTKRQLKMPGIDGFRCFAIFLLISLLAGHAVSETVKHNPFEVMRNVTEKPKTPSSVVTNSHDTDFDELII